jgi:hypothetical protein
MNYQILKKKLKPTLTFLLFFIFTLSIFSCSKEKVDENVYDAGLEISINGVPVPRNGSNFSGSIEVAKDADLTKTYAKIKYTPQDEFATITPKYNDSISIVDLANGIRTSVLTRNGSKGNYFLKMNITYPGGITIQNYNGTENVLGLGIFDHSFHDDSTVLKIYSAGSDTGFVAFKFGSLNGVKVPQFGVLTILKKDLKNAVVSSGDKLSVKINGSFVDVAVYKPEELRDWRDVQGVRNDSITPKFTLMNDIVFTRSGTTYYDPATGSYTIQGDKFVSIKLKGQTFDGNNKQIKNMYLSGSSTNGMFSSATNNAEIKNLILVNILCSEAVNQNVGLLVSQLDRSTIQNVHVVNGNINRVFSNLIYSAGGLVCNANNSRIANSSFKGTINRSLYLNAGLVANAKGGTISQCYADVTTAEADVVGGLVGIANGVSISHSYATGTVTGNGDLNNFRNSAIFGLIGKAEGITPMLLYGCYSSIKLESYRYDNNDILNQKIGVAYNKNENDFFLSVDAVYYDLAKPIQWLYPYSNPITPPYNAPNKVIGINAPSNTLPTGFDANYWEATDTWPKLKNNYY